MTEKLDLDALEEIAGKARVNGKAYLKIFHAIVDPETVSAMLSRIRELEATASPADQVERECDRCGVVVRGVTCMACGYAAPDPADQVEDARDAARYRWILKNAHFTGSYKNVGGFGVCVKLDVLENEGIGAAIDAAMSKQPQLAAA